MPDFNEMYVDPSDSDADFGEINPPGSNITLTDYFRDDTALKFGTEEDQTMYFDSSLDNLVINHESGKISGSLLSNPTIIQTGLLPSIAIPRKAFIESSKPVCCISKRALSPAE